MTEQTRFVGKLQNQKTPTYNVQNLHAVHGGFKNASTPAMTVGELRAEMKIYRPVRVEELRPLGHVIRKLGKCLSSGI